jgi:hypothetical protein
MTISCKAGSGDVVARRFTQMFVADPESDGNDNGGGAKAQLCEIERLLFVSYSNFLSLFPKFPSCAIMDVAAEESSSSSGSFLDKSLKLTAFRRNLVYLLIQMFFE